MAVLLGRQPFYLSEMGGVGGRGGEAQPDGAPVNQ